MDYTSELQKVFQQLGEAGVLVLATSSNDITTARSMSYVQIDGKIYFQTEATMEKALQMKQNPNVALCQNNIAIIGTAISRGKILSAANTTIMDLYKKYHRGSYDAYSHMEKGELYEISPTFITLWTYKEGEPYRTFLDCMSKKAWLEHYDHSK